MRRLIVNADDLGLTAGVNRGIFEAHRKGIVTSATLMASAGACENAVALAVSVPQLSVGCHVVLVDGVALLGSDRIPTLADADGRFRHSLLSFARAVMAGRIRADEICAEAAAQIRKLQQAGLNLTHVDTHKHVHMFPAVLKPLLQAAQACGIQAIRNPYAPARTLSLGQLVRRPELWKRYLEVQVLRRMGGDFRRTVDSHGMVTTDGSCGIVSTGALDAGLFAAIVRCIPEGTWEFVCHPGYSDAELAQVRTRLRESRQREMEVLTAPQARVLLEERNIQLASYRELVASRKQEGAVRG